MATRSLTLFDRTGDTTIAWDEERDEEIRAVIEKKMAEGVRFFIVKPRLGGLVKPKKEEITDVSQIENNAVSIKDEDFIRLMGMCSTGIVPVDSKKETTEIEVVRSATTSKEVSTNHSIGVRPITGG